MEGYMKDQGTSAPDATPSVSPMIKQTEQGNSISSQSSSVAPTAPVMTHEPISQVPEIFSPELTSGPKEDMPSYLAKDEPEMQQSDMLDDRSQGEIDDSDNSDLYNINNFTI